MKLLVLGGTVFLGRQNPHLVPDLEKLRGGRDGDVSALRGRRFDGVIDPSAMTPGQVRATATALEVEYYTFISTISVYRSFPPGRRYDEDAPLVEGAEGYGPLKARAEEALDAAPPGRVARVRLLEECRVVTGSDARWCWMADEALVAADVKPWTELPLWIPESDPRAGGMLLADNQRAVAAGLAFRPLGHTIRATLEWDRAEGLHVPRRALAAEREKAVLEQPR